MNIKGHNTIQQKKQFICSEINCNKSFSRKSRYNYHMNRHNNIKPYKCKNNGCLLSFYSPNDRCNHAKKCKYPQPSSLNDIITVN